MVHVLITGDVHGVGFRQFIRYQARKYSIKGWVKNLPNGSVEAIFEGPEENVRKMINFAKKGPILADVKNVDVKEIPDEGFEDFNILK